MKNNQKELEEIAYRILPDVYSCLKVCHSIDMKSGDTLLKVLVNHFETELLNYEGQENPMVYIANICSEIRKNLTKYFNLSYKKPIK